MKNASSRIVLGFFPAESGNPDSALQTISCAEAQVCLYRADGRVVSSRDFCARYGALRLHGEALVVARSERVQETVQNLRAAGSPSVFVAHEAAEHLERMSSQVKGKRRLLEKLAQHEDEFHRACADLEESLRLNHSLNASAEWLLDNSYLVLTHAA